MESNTRVARRKEERKEAASKRKELGIAYLGTAVEVGTFLLALYAAFF